MHPSLELGSYIAWSAFAGLGIASILFLDVSPALTGLLLALLGLVLLFAVGLSTRLSTLQGSLQDIIKSTRLIAVSTELARLSNDETILARDVLNGELEDEQSLKGLQSKAAGPYGNLIVLGAFVLCTLIFAVASWFVLAQLK